MADAVDALKRVGPIGHHVIGVIIHRVGDLRIVDGAAGDVLGDAHRDGPGTRLFDAQGFAFAGKRELAGERTIAVLIDDAADIGGENAAAHAIENDLRDRRLPVLGFAARFEIDRLGETTHVDAPNPWGR